MWTAISKKTPLWAFVLSIGLLCGGIGYIYAAQSNIRDIANKNSTTLENEFRHINESLREIKARLK